MATLTLIFCSSYFIVIMNGMYLQNIRNLLYQRFRLMKNRHFLVEVLCVLINIWRLFKDSISQK